LDDDVPNSQTISRLSSRSRDLEEQNRRLLSQLDEYSSRITTLEEVLFESIFANILQSMKRRTTSPFRNGNSYSSRSSPSFGSEDEKENSFSKDRKYASLTSGGSGRGMGSIDQATSEIHSWRSAAEVTAALKLKIEQMRRADSKNRQGF
jgi:hypothetical protein